MGHRYNGRKVSYLRYADETTLLTQTKEDIEHLLTLLEKTSLSFGLTLNREKTKMMIVNRAEVNHPDITVIGNCEVVQSLVPPLQTLDDVKMRFEGDALSHDLPFTG